MYTMDYYSTIKRNEIVPFAATWTDLENVILSEVQQRKTITIWYHLRVDIKNNTNESFTKQKQIYRYRKQTDSYQGMVEDKLKVWS